jgi:hypothetical protein
MIKLIIKVTTAGLRLLILATQEAEIMVQSQLGQIVP